MIQNSFGCILIFALSVLLALPIGAYMSRVYNGENSLLDFLNAAEKFIFRFCRIDTQAAMNWKKYLVSMFVLNAAVMFLGFLILLFQGTLFLNPFSIPSMSWHLSLNAAISFITSTNLQHYTPESGASTLSQLGVFMFLQFVSAATSLAVAVALVRGLAARVAASLGNFYVDFLRSLTRILLPLSLLAAALFVFTGVPMNAHGPVAAFLPIKDLGSNGGGFFAANDAHPFENPGFFSFVLHSVLVFLLPMAFVFFIGHQLKAMKFGLLIFSVMSLGFILTTIPIVEQEVKGNPELTRMGIANTGNMEGKEIRYGAFYSAFYAGENAVIPAGSAVGVPDSFMPFSGLCMLMGMHIDSFFGGLGTGWVNIFIFLMISLFIGSLMIGRTAEIGGKKIGIRELQITLSVAVMQSLLPLAFACIACFTYVQYSGGNDSLHWLSNTGSHGFTTMLYEYISCIAGNGSEFSGLGANSLFWNLSTAVVMLCGRFMPIIGTLWIAGNLIEKTYLPPSSGTLKIDTATFGFFLFAVILVVNGLSLFTSMILGPVLENTFLR